MLRSTSLITFVFLGISCGGRTTDHDVGGQAGMASGAGGESTIIGGTTGVGGSSVVTCGQVVCPAGAVCCSPSCGICVHPGEDCPAVACAMPVPGPSGAAGSFSSGTAGAGGSGGATIDGDGGGATGDGGLPACTSTTAASEPMTAVTFCSILSATCRGANIVAAYNTQDKCLASYGASTKMQCQSYHVCLATKMDPALHCQHAQGLDGLCGN